MSARHQKWLEEFFEPIAAQLLFADPSLQAVVYSGNKFRRDSAMGAIIAPEVLAPAVDAAQALRPLAIMDAKAFTATARRRDGSVRVSMDMVNEPFRMPLFFWISAALGAVLLFGFLRQC